MTQSRSQEANSRSDFREFSSHLQIMMSHGVLLQPRCWALDSTEKTQFKK